MIVRTVLGDIVPDQLGRVDAHDHLLVVGGPAAAADPDLMLNDIDPATAEEPSTLQNQ